MEWYLVVRGTKPYRMNHQMTTTFTATLVLSDICEIVSDLPTCLQCFRRHWNNRGGAASIRFRIGNEMVEMLLTGLVDDTFEGIGDSEFGVLLYLIAPQGKDIKVVLRRNDGVVCEAPLSLLG